MKETFPMNTLETAAFLRWLCRNREDGAFLAGGIISAADVAGKQHFATLCGTTRASIDAWRRAWKERTAAEIEAIRSEMGGLRGFEDRSFRTVYAETERRMIELILEDCTRSGSRGEPPVLLWTALTCDEIGRRLVAGRKVAGRKMGIGNVAMSQLLRANGFLQRKRFSQEKGDGSESAAASEAQFRVISDRIEAFIAEGSPVIDVFAMPAPALRDPGTGDAEEGEAGEALAGVTSVWIDGDVAEIAAAAIRRWWMSDGCRRFPRSKRMFVTADCRSPRLPRTAQFLTALRSVATETGLEIHVSHFPDGIWRWMRSETILAARIDGPFTSGHCREAGPLDLTVTLAGAGQGAGGGTVENEPDGNAGERSTAAVETVEDEWNRVLRPDAAFG
ncbi:hypothetical protein [Sutterella sp.]|uniref:ISAzo13-like element transposase-related protein n=1 Tax=Sutterella sp. TaxID=1981025 RepID=UPI0026DEC181|nr:hypothetical protein [Sutterella sp.]MDO5532480.1 hypothetical protein [Sutterella sp.]